MTKRIVISMALTIGSLLGVSNDRENPIGVIPTPKEIKTTATADFHVGANAAIFIVGDDCRVKSGATEIQDRARELTGKEIPVKTIETAISTKNDAIIVGTADAAIISSYLKKVGADTAAALTHASGYVIKAARDSKRNVFIIAGKDSVGAMYGCVTFANLLRQDTKENIKVTSPDIGDWPDSLFRMVQLKVPLNSVPDAKRYIDWCFRHKVNLVFIGTYSITDGEYAIPKKPEVIGRLREINEYAKTKGISAFSLTYATVGYIPEDKDKPEFSDLNTSGKGYWSWSADALIKSRGERMGEFIRSAGFAGYMFHFRDGSPSEYWNDRGEKCRKRFGDDRAAADANYINITVREVKKKKPDTIIVVVTEPYYGDLNVPANRPYRDYYARLSRQIPPDVYLVNASHTIDAQKSWIDPIRQPILQWRNYTFDNYHTGCDFSTQTALSLASGLMLPNAQNIPYANLTLGPYSSEEAAILLALELVWNHRLPGVFPLRCDANATPKRVVEDIFEYPLAPIEGLAAEKWLWEKSAIAPAALVNNYLPKICADLYGEESAPVMTEVLKKLIPKRVILMEGPVYRAGIGAKYWRNVEAMETYRHRAEEAVGLLKELKTRQNDFRKGPWTGNRLDKFIANYKVAAAAAGIHSALISARNAMYKNYLKAAAESAKRAETALADALREFRGDTFANIQKESKNVKFKLELLNSLKTRKTEGGVKVAIYAPGSAGGSVFGENAIYNTLLATNDIAPTLVPSLDNLFVYDCLIVPNCTRFSTKDSETFISTEKEIHVAEQKIRDFVEKQGKGALFYHDSVGYRRFPLSRSAFPELCAATDRIESDKIRLTATHPIAENMKIGETVSTLYYDHIGMKKGEKGEAIFADDKGMAAVIVGDVGKGRVVLNGTVIASRAGEPLKAEGFDRQLLIDSVKWLCRKK